MFLKAILWFEAPCWQSHPELEGFAVSGFRICAILGFGLSLLFPGIRIQAAEHVRKLDGIDP